MKEFIQQNYDNLKWDTTNEQNNKSIHFDICLETIIYNVLEFEFSRGELSSEWPFDF